MKTLFITGGNGEIGAAIAQTFASVGFNIISPRSKEFDCSNPNAIAAYFKTFDAKSIDAFVHCAGINDPKVYTDISPQTLNKTLNINALSFLYITQHLTPYLNAQSRIVGVSSIYGNISRVKRLEYSASKHALVAMVKTLALEMAKKGVLVNAVSPGFIETKLTYKNNNKEVIDQLIADVPLNKLGEPAYVAELVYFLCSQKNQFITGQDIVIDGGYLTGGFQN